MSDMNAPVIPSPRFLLLLLLSALCPLCLCGEASAGPDMNGPYRLQVVLRFGDHRAFTDVFKQQVEDGLRDNLRAAFGGMAQVEVVRTHPRLAEVEKNLQALDSWKEVSDVKTHFVLIDYVDNTYYQVQARQHDGLTGQASPVIRRERTTERPFLARTISFLIDQDFGIVGEITNQGEKAHVDVALKGAGLGKSLDRWVKIGDVFRIAQVVGRGSERAFAVPDAVLQVESLANKEGIVKCRLFNRYKDPLKPAPGSLGFRCIKLGTTKAPLRVRLMLKDARPPKPLSAYPIHVHRQSFESNDAKQGASHSDGYSSRLGEFENVAFVVVYKPPQQGKDEVLARVPVPILDDRPVTIALNIKQEKATPLLLAQDNWASRINDVYLTNKGRFQDLSEHAKKSPPAELQKEAVQFLVDLRADIDNLVKERESLIEMQKDTPEIKLDLKAGDQGIERLRQDHDELDKFVTAQRDAIEKANDPKRLEALNLVVRARGLEAEHDYEQAIKVYEEAQEVLNDANLGKKIERLKTAWKVKGDEHREARAFAYKEWPAAFDVNQLREFKDRIGRAGQMFEVCRKAEDPLTVKKLLATAIVHQEKLKDILSQLHGDVNEEQAEPQRQGQEALTALVVFLEKVSDYLKETLKDQ
jgi:hypothetical protein